MRIRLLSIGLFTLLVASQADAQSQNDSVLNNAQGATPCDMLQTFPSHCENPQTRDDNDNDTTQAPTACTCTNVYFNLWSACAFTKTPADLPSCDTFQKNCSQALINVTTLQQNNTPYPNWAFVELPANDTFDIVAAIASAEGLPSHKWTVIQIVLPIVVGIVSAVIVLLGVVFYRRRKNKNRGQRDWMQTIGNRPRFNFPTFSSLQRVRELDRSNSWSIDDRQEDLQEYQFVSYPASLQGSRVSGHVRLSSSSSGTSLPPPLQIPEKRPPVRTWPGKSIWKRPLRSARELSDSMPRPWRKAVGVKNIPGYKSFRVDAEDSDSPLSQHPHTQSLLGYSGRSRSNLHRETIFEQEPDEPEDDVESDDEALPFIPQEHSSSNHDAIPPPEAIPPRPSTSGGESNGSQRTRQVPPPSTPPRIPLPLLPSISAKPQSVVPVASTSSQEQPIPQRSAPNLPPAPTSPPPPPPSIARRSPRSIRSPLPAQFANSPPLPSPPLLSPPPSNNLLLNNAPPLPQPRRRRDSDEGSSIRTLPMTPTPPYVRGAPAPIQVLEPEPTGETPPHSAPPYAPAMPPTSPPGAFYSHPHGAVGFRSCTLPA
ncbi:hypothetical protein MSAN_01468300 [Mycena sanguinolenta]|uniref:Extracellular membrane protein CFEM domain-containing protein n=1 Tax=Mycena sanguinolenta TaxID=230812 RepID=A0A8H6YAN6_9AGAR|nr:hypothetical protein MSAN_01468300 [Mycena sanguinolenta]